MMRAYVECPSCDEVLVEVEIPESLLSEIELDDVQRVVLDRTYNARVRHLREWCKGEDRQARHQQRWVWDSTEWEGNGRAK